MIQTLASFNGTLLMGRAETGKTETIKSEIEITLPYYSKYGKLFYYKVISETLMLKVTSPFDDQPNTELTSKAMRPSATFNAILAKIA